MTDVQQRNAAKEFAEFWKDKGYEKGQSQQYWMSLLTNVLGVTNAERFIEFENQVALDHTSFIDGYISETHVLIEQKSIQKNLDSPIKQSDGTLLTPFQQAKRYSAELPYSKRARWIVISNFKEIMIYDMETPSGEPQIIKLENLEKEYYRLKFLVDTGDENIKKELEVSVQAGELVGVIYDAFAKQYKDIQSEESQKSLNKLCVRLVFCMYAEDAGIFGEHGKFHRYMEQYQTKDCRRALIDLFKVLDTKIEKRDPYMDEMLASFPYVNGGLFSDEDIEIPQFTDEIRTILLSKASEDFDWSEISPTIFGAVFESTLNPETRRSGGMHYTSIENIHKVINPLFLNDLKEELSEIKTIGVDKTRIAKLKEYQKKIASLVFLDPAAGSGNFLTQTYLDLRILENEVIRLIADSEKGAIAGQISFVDEHTNPIQVSIGQFYGIEINDFAVTVAQTALWIAENQMMKKTEDILHMNLDFLPLKSYSNIHEGNALRMNWEDVVSKDKLNYIMGNPPFVGGMVMSKEQKEDITNLFCNLKGVGELDYVCGWYKKAIKYIKNTNIFCAFVSTNSICQGQQATSVWKPFMEAGVIINYAYRTFIWDSEAKQKAHVHCVIIGFSCKQQKEKYLYDNGKVMVTNSINQYLTSGPSTFIESLSKPLCDVPQMKFGNMPRDGGGFVLTEEEKEKLEKNEPLSSKWIRPYIGSYELINNKKRYCLWMVNADPTDVKKCPTIMKRIQAVKEFRENSVAAGTRKFAQTPMLFCQIAQTEDTYIAVPKTSSERRRYIPMDFLSAGTIASDLLFMIPNANKYHFAILMSNIHNAWMRTICGRLKSDYRYAKDIVYNNFPWPTPTDDQKRKIEQTAQEILDARAKYPDSSLADLYDPLTMPPELITAHQHNDKAVMQAYGFKISMTESECVAELMKMYQELSKESK